MWLSSFLFHQGPQETQERRVQMTVSRGQASFNSGGLACCDTSGPGAAATYQECPLENQTC